MCDNASTHTPCRCTRSIDVHPSHVEAHAAKLVHLARDVDRLLLIDAVEQEDADVVGISMLNAGHLTLGPRMVEALADAGLDVPVVIGGIVPDEDLPAMANAGVAGVLGPGATAEEVVACVRAAADARG